MPLEFCPVSLNITYACASEVLISANRKDGTSKIIYQGAVTFDGYDQVLNVGVALNDNNFFESLSFTFINTYDNTTAPYIRYIKESDGYIIDYIPEKP